MALAIPPMSCSVTCREEEGRGDVLTSRGRPLYHIAGQGGVSEEEEGEGAGRERTGQASAGWLGWLVTLHVRCQTYEQLLEMAATAARVGRWRWWHSGGRWWMWDAWWRWWKERGGESLGKVNVVVS
ncbi:hypothetical protein E2C01_081402 [Portunus trituberculatus]|uniref:Uncharacterized protein n=1 Tax=Portunus trituberculatus TaxID=210409 RepID=A0A5B7IWJ6_PORTR|nr:hypothetical protein [Portunus trituberculatus]